VPATEPAPVNLGKPTTLPPDASGTGEGEEKQKSDE
jgi:hypothetical protein